LHRLPTHTHNCTLHTCALPTPPHAHCYWPPRGTPATATLPPACRAAYCRPLLPTTYLRHATTPLPHPLRGHTRIYRAARTTPLTYLHAHAPTRCAHRACPSPTSAPRHLYPRSRCAAAHPHTTLSPWMGGGYETVSGGTEAHCARRTGRAMSVLWFCRWIARLVTAGPTTTALPISRALSLTPPCGCGWGSWTCTGLRRGWGQFLDGRLGVVRSPSLRYASCSRWRGPTHASCLPRATDHRTGCLCLPYNLPQRIELPCARNSAVVCRNRHFHPPCCVDEQTAFAPTCRHHHTHATLPPHQHTRDVATLLRQNVIG